MSGARGKRPDSGSASLNLFRECAPRSADCPKQAEYDALLQRFAEYACQHSIPMCQCTCPPPVGFEYPKPECKAHDCRDIKQHIECMKTWILAGGDVLDRTPYQQAVLDGREKCR